MRNQGQITPVLVDFGPRRPVLVVGYKRALAAKALGLPVLALEVLPEPGRNLEADRGLAYLASNQGQAMSEERLLTAARYFQKCLPLAEFMSLAGPLLGLAESDRRWRLIEAWLGLPTWLDGLAPLACAPRLGTLGPQDLEALRPYLQVVRFPRNHLDNFLAFLGQAALAKGRSLADLLGGPELVRCREADLSPADKLARLTGAAMSLSHPRLAGLTARFAGLAAKLTAGTRFRIHPAQGFESDTVRLEVSLKDRQGLAKAARDLAALAQREQWDELWGTARAKDQD